MRKPVHTIEAEVVGETTIRDVEEETHANEDIVEVQTVSPPTPTPVPIIIESSNPIGHIMGVLDDLRRDEEGEEVSTALGEHINVDAECALATQLEEQGNLMPIEEVVGSFVNEPDLEADYERVCSWRNWRISHLKEINAKLKEMWDEEMFALKWLGDDSVYQALDPNFIEGRKAQRLPLYSKGKEVLE